MLIVPASKVSVPFAVVMRTRSSVPPRVISPAVNALDVVDVFTKPFATHIFEPSAVTTTVPEIKPAAVISLKLNPAVELTLFTDVVLE